MALPRSVHAVSCYPPITVGAISESRLPRCYNLHCGAKKHVKPNQPRKTATYNSRHHQHNRVEPDGGYIYRGERKLHKEHPGKVSSNLWREYRMDDEHFNIEVIHCLMQLKSTCGQLPQDYRVDYTASEDTDETNDFEILTDIQHYEGKTNLIDFTTDYFIALFFACDGSPNEDGRVILQKTDLIKNWIKYPQNPRHRVIAQKSVFVRPPRGFIEPQEDDIVIIPKNQKQSMLRHLRKFHGLKLSIMTFTDLSKSGHSRGCLYTLLQRSCLWR